MLRSTGPRKIAVMSEKGIDTNFQNILLKTADLQKEESILTPTNSTRVLSKKNGWLLHSKLTKQNAPP
jgi:hypothetical protein